jgi:putative SOS response-associated peptidase YedK
MCGRFALTLPPDAMARLFDATLSNDLPGLPNYNICPTNRVFTAISTGQGRRLGAMRWGFVPHWYESPSDGPLLINARAETIADKPAFRSAVRKRRCLIAADGFYEWEKDAEGNRLPWYVTRSDGAPMIFAGIWQMWGAGEARMPTCAIVTTEAGPDIAPIHHRQPVILDQDAWPLWLGEAGTGARQCLTATPRGGLSSWRVAARVNSNRASGPGLIRPLDAT